MKKALEIDEQAKAEEYIGEEGIANIIAGLRDSRRAEDLFSDDKIHQTVEEARKRLHELLKNTQKHAFEIYSGDEIS